MFGPFLLLLYLGAKKTASKTDSRKTPTFHQTYKQPSHGGLTYGTYVFKSNSYCFQSGNSDGAVVRIGTYEGLAEQQWDVFPKASGYFAILNHASHLALEVRNVSTIAGGHLDVSTPTGGDNQLWRIDDQGSGSFILKNKQSGRVLAIQNSSMAASASIVQATYSGKHSQTWKPSLTNLLRICISGKNFVYPNGDIFKVWGFNYLSNKDQDLMEDKWDDPAVMKQIGADLTYLQSIGTNVVRLVLQYNKFVNGSTTTFNQANIQLLKGVIDTATKDNIHLIITGLGAYRNADQASVPFYTGLSDADHAIAQANWWKAIAGALSGNPTILGYDLVNEPYMPPAPEQNWNNDNNLSDPTAANYSQYLQRTPVGFGQATMAPWIAQMRQAIRTVDPVTPITVGFAGFPGATPWSGLIGDVDFVCYHSYPGPGNDVKELSLINAYNSGSTPLLIEEYYPLYCNAADAYTFAYNNRKNVAGWVSIYLHHTIVQGAKPPSNATDYSWLMLFNTNAAIMRTP